MTRKEVIRFSYFAIYIINCLVLFKLIKKVNALKEDIFALTNNSEYTALNL